MPGENRSLIKSKKGAGGGGEIKQRNIVGRDWNKIWQGLKGRRNDC